MLLKALMTGPAELLLDPLALGQAVLDALDAAVALLRVVVARVDDDYVARARRRKDSVGRSGIFILGMVTTTTSPARAASSTVTGLRRSLSPGRRGSRSARVRDGDLMAERGEPAGERATDISGADDSDLHVVPLSG